MLLQKEKLEIYESKKKQNEENRKCHLSFHLLSSHLNLIFISSYNGSMKSQSNDIKQRLITQTFVPF